MDVNTLGSWRGPHLPRLFGSALNSYLLCLLQGRVTANGRVGATAAVYTAAILGEGPLLTSTLEVLTSWLEVSCGFSVALSDGLACAEYLTAEVLELAGNASKDLKVNSTGAHPLTFPALLRVSFSKHLEFVLFSQTGEAYYSPSLATGHPW